MDLPKVYRCEECDKEYKHRQSLYNHNKKFHSILPQKTQNNTKSTQKTTNSHKNNDLICVHCNKKYSRIDSLNRHLKICKNKKENSEIDKLKKENNDLKAIFQKELNEMKEQIRILMNKNCKMHPKTLQKINNQLNNCNIINIVQLGKEDIVGTLSSKDKLNILNNKYLSFNKLIEHVHFNDKYPQFKNIAITNLKDDYAYKFNEKDNKFIACKKEEVIDELMDYRTIDLEEILNENIDKINNFDVKKIKDLIVKLYDKSELYETNKNNIKLMIYNKCDKNDIII